MHYGFYNEYLNCSVASRPHHSQNIQMAWTRCTCFNLRQKLLEFSNPCSLTFKQFLIETVLFSTQNICLGQEIRNLSITLIKRTSPYDYAFYNEHLNCSAAIRPDHSQYIQKAWHPCACGNGCSILIEKQIICRTGHTQVFFYSCTEWSYFPWQSLALSFLSSCPCIALSYLKKNRKWPLLENFFRVVHVLWQTVKTQMKCSIHFIRVCSVCLD